MKKLTIYLILLLLVVGGCKKSEDELVAIIPSKESLLCREWKLEEEYKNGEEFQTTTDLYLDIKKDGTFKMTSFYGTVEVIKNWKWRWADNKETFEMFPLDKGLIKTFMNNGLYKNSKDIWLKQSIKLLNSKEFIIERESGGDLYRMEFKERGIYEK